MFLPLWLQFPGLSSGLLELPITGSRLEWSLTSSEGGVDIGMYRLMKMLRSFDLRMKSLENVDALRLEKALFIWGRGIYFLRSTIWKRS